MDHYPKAAQIAGSAIWQGAGSTIPAPPPPRQTTAIESLTRELSAAVNRLNLNNDNVEQKLQMFMPHDAPTPANRVEKESSPPDGTMAALIYEANRLRLEVERYSHLWERLATII